jgi:hypothetical protein
MSIYKELLDAGVEMDHHESDLYVKVTPKSREILTAYGRRYAEVFISEIDGLCWYDLPFAYEPFWEKKG